MSLEQIKDTAKEILQAVLPIVAIVVMVLLIFFENPWHMVGQFLVGAAMVILGLVLFMLGVNIGLLPLGEIIGSEISQKGSVLFLIFTTFLIGVAVTVAEPNLRVLAHQIDMVSGGEITKQVLVTFVAIGVGISMTIAALRVILGVPMSHVIVVGYLIILGAALLIQPHFAPISFDAGGVTTGPLLVPFILALGVGLTSVLGGKSSLSDSFGFVAMIFIGPIIAVMLLGVIYG